MADSTYLEASAREHYGVEEEVLDIIRSSVRCGFTSTVDEVQERLAAGNSGIAMKCATAIDILEKSGRIMIENGEIVLRGQGDVSGRAHERRRMAGEYMSFGLSFLEGILPSVPDVLMAGICGSVSYGSAGPDDDIDIMLVCRNGTLWSVMRKVLLAARSVRKREPRKPIMCLSYCAGDDAFREEAASHRTRLFASDCLNIRVVKGRDYYTNVLESSTWMSSCYPLTYAARVAEGNGDDVDCGGSAGGDRLNYLLIGGYLKTMAWGRNLALRLKGREDELFTARIERDRCVYASDRWRRLEEV